MCVVTDPRRVRPTTERDWIYAGLSSAWTHTGNPFPFALTPEGSENAAGVSAHRLGGVLLLYAECPMRLPGYYSQKISARRFAYYMAASVAPLSAHHRWQRRRRAASAYVDYPPKCEQRGHWQTGLGSSLCFAFQSDV